jgi:dolichyl-phosphate beta-glucosyltransferase
VLDVLGADTEIVIVDDGSSDNTLATAREVYGHLDHLLAVRQEPNLGKGAAVRLGMGLASGNQILVADADMAINPRHFPDMLAALDEVDVAPGSRVEGRRVRYDSFVRNLASDVFHYLVKHYTGLTLRDTQCGAKAFRAGPARLLALLATTNGFAYDAEILSLAQRLDFSLRPVSVTWDDVSGSTVNVGADAIKMIRDLRRVSHHVYQNPAVEVDLSVDVAELSRAARDVRANGLVLARNSANGVVVLSREGSLAGAGIAAAVGGRLRTTNLNELRGRELVVV